MKSGDEYSTSTGEGGHFTFELPVGQYDVSPAPEYGLLEVEEGFAPMLKGSVSVEKHRCWEHDFAVKPAASVVPPNDGRFQAILVPQMGGRLLCTRGYRSYP